MLDVPFQPDRIQGCLLDNEPPGAGPGWCYFDEETRALQQQTAGWIAGRRETRGTLLVTGFRGVGKTSFVAQALRLAAAEFAKQTDTRTSLLVVWLDVPKVVSPKTLLGRLVRQTYVQMVRSGVGEFAPDVVAQARAAYVRTLAARAETKQRSSTVTAGVELGVDAFKLSAQQEVEFLEKLECSYEVNDADRSEEDLLNVLSALGRPFPPGGRVERAKEAFAKRLEALRVWAFGKNGRNPKPTDVRVVYVLDELDKLDKPSQFQAIFRSLKTLLTTSDATFVLIAGAEQEADWLHAEREANSILSSLVAWRAYVPLLQGDEDVAKAVRALTGGRELSPLHATVLRSRAAGVPKAVARILRTEFCEVDDTDGTKKVEPKRPRDYLVENRRAVPTDWADPARSLAANEPRYYHNALFAWRESARWLGAISLYSSAAHAQLGRLGLPETFAPTLASPTTAGAGVPGQRGTQ